MDSKVCDTIFEDNGFSGTKFQILKEKLNYTLKSNQFILAKKIRENCHQYLKTWFNITYNGISRFFLITVMYLDLSMDSIVLFVILFVLGPTLTDQSLFSTQIAILLLLSIVVPGMLTAIDIAYNRPVVVAGPDAWVRFKKLDKTESKKELTFLRIMIVLLFPIVPALIALSDEKAKHKTELLKDKCNQKDYIVQDSDIDKLEQLDAFINECRLGLLTFKRFELSLELVTQLAIHVSMILLTKTKFPLESGLQSIFRNSEEEDENSDSALTFLILSVLWSFKTTALTSIKIKKDTKNFLPVFPTLILGIRYLLVFLVRIGCIVAYYAPFLGLVGIVDHYQAETLSLDKEIWQKINTTDNQQFRYWNNFTNKYENVTGSKIFRSNNETTGEFKLPSTTHYTLIRLQTAYIYFAICYLLYALLLCLMKTFMNDHFNGASFGAKFQHIVDALNNPEAYGDWDTDNSLDLIGHLKKWKQILVEMLVMVLLQFLTNLCLLVPLIITGII
jgi:hypothetical protein